MRRGKDRGEFAAAVIGLAAVIFAVGFLMYLEWYNYVEKMEILYVVMAQCSEGYAPIDIVTGMLKGVSAEDTASAELQLEQYGYCEAVGDHYKKSLYGSWTVTAAAGGGLYVIFIVLLRLQANRMCRRRRDELQWLQRRVSALRDSAAGTPPDNSVFGNVSMGDVLDEANAELGSFMMELSALADSVAVSRERAEQEKEGVKSLVTDISHQLKTPVAALKTSFEILQAGQLTEMEHQEFLGRCSTQIRRLEELAAALVNVSRLETGLIVLKKEERAVFDTLLLAVNRIYPKLEEKAMELELEADESLQQLTVHHDPKWLSEAFLNVLENAVKYSEAGTKITIRMMKMTVCLRIEIEDEGIGIPKKERNRIFQRFYRGEAKEVQQASGSGVGLYLAREIVARHEGTLSVTAPQRQKRGSCFVFQIPCSYSCLHGGACDV